MFHELLRKQNRQNMLKMLDKESEQWLSNIEHWKVNLPVSIPNNYDKQSDYYLKLQEKAALLVGGNYDELEDLEMNEGSLDYKNSHLVPLYANIKSLAQRLKSSELDRIYNEYNVCINGLKASDVK